MVERVDLRIRRTVQNETNNHTLRKEEREGKRSNFTQISSDMAYHHIQYLGSTLDLCLPSFKKDYARDANKLCDNESKTVSGKFDNNSTVSEIATSNCECNVLKRDFEAKKNGDKIHDGCVSSLSITEKLKALKHNLGNCSESILFVAMIGQAKSHHNPVDLYTLTLELPKNPQAQLSVKEPCNICEYVIEQIASHQTNYGMIFLDCFGRVFIWEDTFQMAYPLGDSLEEAQNNSIEESGNLSTTNDYNDLGNLIYYDDDDGGGSGGGGEKNKITKPCKPSLINYRNIAYNILKYLEDDIVKNKEIQELGQCTECTNNILSSPIKVLTILTCGHIFHRPCIEKQLLHTKPSTCPFPDCGKNVDIIVDPNSIRRGSQSSQSSGTLALTNLIGKKVVLNSPVIPKEGSPSNPMNVDPNGNVALINVLLSGREQRSSKTTGVAKKTSNQATNPDNSENMDDSELSSKQIQRPLYKKCSEEISIEFTKDTVFCHCPTCLVEDLELFPVELTSSTTQKKCTRESTAKKSSSKKKKTTNKDDISTMLKKLIEELLTNIPNTEQAKKKNEDATQNVINRYFAFGEALYLRYKKLKSSYSKDRAKALVEEEVRKQIPKTKFSDEALQKKRGRFEKAYILFNSIGKSKIERIRSFFERSILNLSDTNVDCVIAGVLRAEWN
ncbi:hypothetical protein RhiirA5_457077 [Rhizophagus irregularis]|uniref:RING-type domain-containing protein n=1 Tax=Rhizophagus irregularis TaxID=588596 RepID=A0A2N0P326_9GLOM|nr:hypothetical protein RhiirA5_457077 [Rhizophagus irregularis]